MNRGSLTLGPEKLISDTGQKASATKNGVAAKNHGEVLSMISSENEPLFRIMKSHTDGNWKKEGLTGTHFRRLVRGRTSALTLEGKIGGPKVQGRHCKVQKVYYAS